MKLSIFTPTHDPQFLSIAYQSILRQTEKVDWEWVIVPNNNVQTSELPSRILSDKNVKVIPTERKGIGALKNFACYQCTGDLFIELDHDDILTSDAFASILEASTQTPDGFYYSDFINLKSSGTCETYSLTHGWENYKCIIDGKRYTANRAFEPSARSLSSIHYAPNHVRVWSRKAYYDVKGHDPSLSICDDHDLICRTYLNGAPFVFIRKPLYIYKRYPQNTFVSHKQDIKEQQLANLHKYLHQLIDQECKQKGLEVLTLTAENRREFALTLGTKHNKIGCIKANDFWQKVPSNEIVYTLNIIYDVLAPGGWLLTSTPAIDDGKGTPGRGAFQDPTNKSYWSPNNWKYFTDKKQATLLPDYQGRFQEVRNFIDYPSDFHKQNFIPYVYADLCALKGQRQPGLCTI